MKYPIKIAAIVAVVIALCAVTITLSDSSDAVSYSDSNYKYTLNSNGTATITGYVTEPTGDLVLPSSVSYTDPDTQTTTEYAITTIGNPAFKGTSITSVTIPEGVTTVGMNAFQDCTSLQTVNLSSTVTMVSNYAFRGCTAITTITVAEGNTSYKVIDNALIEIDGGKEVDGVSTGDSLVIAPRGSIGTSYTVPDGVSQIETYALDGLNLESIDLGDSYYSSNSSTDILNLFYGMSKLKNISVSSQYLTSVNGAVMSTDGNVLLFIPHGIQDYTVPSTVQSVYTLAIGNSTVSRANDTLQTITFEGSNTTLSGSVFRNCSELNTVTLPSGLETIPYGTFYNCTSLTTVNNLSNVKTVESDAFPDLTAHRHSSPTTAL